MATPTTPPSGTSAGAGAQARVETARASRYLAQLRRHVGRIGRGHLALRQGMGRERPTRLEVHGSDSVVTVAAHPWGRCTFEATPQALEVRVVAADEDGLRRLQDLVTANLTRFGRRDGLTVTWEPMAVPDPGLPEEHGQPEPARDGRRGRVALAAVVGLALMVGLHLGAASGLAAIMSWWGWTVAGLVVVAAVVVVVHLAVPAVVIHRARRTRRHSSTVDGR